MLKSLVQRSTAAATSFPSSRFCGSAEKARPPITDRPHELSGRQPRFATVQAVEASNEARALQLVSGMSPLCHYRQLASAAISQTGKLSRSGHCRMCDGVYQRRTSSGRRRPAPPLEESRVRGNGGGGKRKKATCLALIILCAASRSPFNAGLCTRKLMSSSLRLASPASVRAYSSATSASATPRRLRITAHITPVLSLPAVQ